MLKSTFIDELNETDIEIEFDDVFCLKDNTNNNYVVFDKITAKFILNFINLNTGEICKS
jgi:hypothetical protein